MAELRFRTARIQRYARLCPAHASPEEHREFHATIDRQDEDGIVALLARHPSDPTTQRVVEILQRAREIGDRVNILDRALPALPHPEIADCYAELRTLGDAIDSLEA